MRTVFDVMIHQPMHTHWPNFPARPLIPLTSVPVFAVICNPCHHHLSSQSDGQYSRCLPEYYRQERVLSLAQLLLLPGSRGASRPRPAALKLLQQQLRFPHASPWELSVEGMDARTNLYTRTIKYCRRATAFGTVADLD